MTKKQNMTTIMVTRIGPCSLRVTPPGPPGLRLGVEAASESLELASAKLPGQLLRVGQLAGLGPGTIMIPARPGLRPDEG